MLDSLQFGVNYPGRYASTLSTTGDLCRLRAISLVTCLVPLLRARSLIYDLYSLSIASVGIVSNVILGVDSPTVASL